MIFSHMLLGILVGISPEYLNIPVFEISQIWQITTQILYYFLAI